MYTCMCDSYSGKSTFQIGTSLLSARRRDRPNMRSVPMRRLPLVRLVAAACCALPLASAADAAYSYEQASSYEGGGDGQGEAMLACMDGW